MLFQRHSVEPSGVRELHSVLATLPASQGTIVSADNLRLVHRLARPQRCLLLLRTVLEDRELLHQIAARSYPHVNHFDKIVLVDTGAEAGYRLTLHLWQPPYTETQLHEEMIHDHRFSFWSSVLTGTLRCENFVPVCEGDPYRHYQYVPEKLGVTTVSNFYDFIGPARLARTEPSVHLAGDTYHLDFRATHRVKLPTETMTCTLVLRGPRMRQHSNVFNTHYPTSDVECANVCFSERELTERLVALMRALELRFHRPIASSRDALLLGDPGE